MNESTGRKIEDLESQRVMNLHLALSRLPDRPKMYVQNMIKAEGKMICELFLRDDCTYYVCGDANMADYCQEAVVEALGEHALMSRVKATRLLQRMRAEGRWQYDLWGISAYIDDGNYSKAKKSLAKRKSHRALNWLSIIRRKSSRQFGDSDDDDDDDDTVPFSYGT
jgi:hypothetical protein